MSSSNSAFNQEKEISKLWELELNALEQQMRMEKQEAQEREHQQRIKTLTDVAERMRKDGKSEQSIQAALKGFDEYLKPARRATRTKLVHIQPGQPKPTSNPGGVEMLGVWLSEVKTQQIDWLWPKRIPLGKITILDGDPGMGKSLLAVSVAASVSTGQPMPDGSPSKQGGVILIAPEDSAGDTIKPRLKAAGGDPSRVLLLNTIAKLNAKKIKIDDRSFSLSHDLDSLEEAIKQMKAVLVILDPLTAVLGKNIDQSRDQNVREVFTPLAQLAERTNCAVLIIRHLSKVGSANLLYRGAGSIGIIAAARLGLIVIQDPDDEQKRILATTKNNLSKQASNLTFQVVENGRGVPYIQWLGESNYSLKALSNGTNLSIQRQDILSVLKDASYPLTPKEIAERTGQKYEAVRLILSRMHEAQEIARPYRGKYTSLHHPSIIKQDRDKNDDTSDTCDTTDTSDTLIQ